VSCSRTELKRCSDTDRRWNRNDDARSSPEKLLSLWPRKHNPYSYYYKRVWLECRTVTNTLISREVNNEKSWQCRIRKIQTLQFSELLNSNVFSRRLKMGNNVDIYLCRYFQAVALSVSQFPDVDLSYMYNASVEKSPESKRGHVLHFIFMSRILYCLHQTNEDEPLCSQFNVFFPDCVLPIT